MVQVTPNPREPDPKMSEEKRAKEAPGGAKTPKPEAYNVRFEWSALPAGQGPDTIAYKNQRRQGDVTQGVQTVPTVWVPTQPDGQWQYGGVTEGGISSETRTQLIWYGVREIIILSGMIVLLILVLKYSERSRKLWRLRHRQEKVKNTKVDVICQVEDELSSTKLPTKPNDLCNEQEIPLSYSKIDIQSEAITKEGKQKDLFPPYLCVFGSGKNKVPQVLMYEACKDKEVMDKMRLSSFEGQPSQTQHVEVNVPSQVDVNDPNKEMANLVFEIRDTENESGCIIGLDIHVDKNHEDAKVFEDLTGIPITINLENLKSEDPKPTKKSEDDEKK